jgi:hypothetical protein
VEGDKDYSYKKIKQMDRMGFEQSIIMVYKNGISIKTKAPQKE